MTATIPSRSFTRAPRNRPRLASSLHTQITMIRQYDPSITSDAQVALTYSGLHTVWCYRVSHRLWVRGHRLATQIVCQIGRVFTGVEIHPAARIGKRLLIAAWHRHRDRRDR